MGAVGHIIQMNNSLKANRASRRSQRQGYKDDFDNSTLSKGRLKFKELSPEELEIVLDEIRSSQRKIKRSRLSVFSGIIGVISILFLLLY